MVKTKDVTVSIEVYWALVKRKLDGEFRSIDEVLRPILGIAPGPRSRLKRYTRRLEDMEAVCKTVTGYPAIQSQFGIARRTENDGEAMYCTLADYLRQSSPAQGSSRT